MREKIRRFFMRIRHWVCGRAFGHVWNDEKEFVSCKRRFCHKSITKRELTQLTLKGKRA